MLNFCDAEARRKVWRRGTQSKDSPITCYGNTRADRVRFVTTLNGHQPAVAFFSCVFSSSQAEMHYNSTLLQSTENILFPNIFILKVQKCFYIFHF